VPLTPELPPKNLPRLSFTWRLSTPAIGGVTRFQSVSASRFLDQPPIILMFSLSLESGPASTSRMLVLAFSASRAAMTQPLVPPPLSVVSDSSCNAVYTSRPDNVVVAPLYHGCQLVCKSRLNSRNEAELCCRGFELSVCSFK